MNTRSPKGNTSKSKSNRIKFIIRKVTSLFKMTPKYKNVDHIRNLCKSIYAKTIGNLIDIQRKKNKKYLTRLYYV